MLAWKNAHLMLWGTHPSTQFALHALTQHWVHEPEAFAACMAGRSFYPPADPTAGCSTGDHAAPSYVCNCGFYGMKRVNETPNTGAGLLMRVEFAGMILPYGEGYRAQWQRILGVYFGRCMVCGERPATVGMRDSTQRFGVEVSPVCSECRVHRFGSERAYTLSEITGGLGIEVTPLPEKEFLR